MILDKTQIYIIDNFVDKEKQSQILDNLYSSPLTLGWTDIAYDNQYLRIDHSQYSPLDKEKQFVMNLGSKKTSLLKILENRLDLKIQKVLRSKLNWIPREHIKNKNKYYPPHIDNNLDHWVFIYYVNTSDGNTLIFNETQNQIPPQKIFNQTLTIRHSIEHKQGRGVLFHGSIYHCGLPPIESDNRILFNHNFILE